MTAEYRSYEHVVFIRIPMYGVTVVEIVSKVALVQEISQPLALRKMH